MRFLLKKEMAILSACVLAAVPFGEMGLSAAAAPAASIFYDGFESGVGEWAGRGGAAVAVSSKAAYAGTSSLLVSGRTAGWNGAQKSLSTTEFAPGTAYSFSADVCFLDGTAMSQTFLLSLQYTDAAGETAYDHIATAETAKGFFVQLANTAYTIPAGASDLLLYVETEDSSVNYYLDEVVGAASGTVIEGPKPVTFQLGDANCDGTIDGSDLSFAKGLLLWTKDTLSNTALQYKAADVNCDGTVTMADLVWFVQYLTGQTKVLPEKLAPPPGEMRTISEYTPVVQAQMSEFETSDSKQEKAGVAYGTVKGGSYYSTTCKRNKKYNILLPANYSEDKKYPVLYVMHGYYENQDRMILKGNGTMYTRQIIGNAIASGDAEDMIVVFPYIYSSATQDAVTGMDDANNRAYDNFINDLVTDLMPHLEQTYSIKTGRENTAITGFSMGGRESLLIGMQRPDLFGYVGAICPAPGVTGAFKWASEEEAPSLVMITAGSNDTVVYSNPETYNNNFKKNGVPTVWHYVNGGYHGDNSIHAHIYNFVRAVFKA